MNILTHIATLELIRKKTKGSRRAIDILMVVEKLAAAGCCYHPTTTTTPTGSITTTTTTTTTTTSSKQTSNNNNDSFARTIQAAADSLVGSKHVDNLPLDAIATLVQHPMHMWSPRPLLWLWRRAHLFHKVTKQDIATSISLESLLLLLGGGGGATASAAAPKFDNPYLPLVIDIGCGLGVTLLGLATGYRSSGCSNKNGPSSSSCGSKPNPLNDYITTTNHSKYNYLGADLSPKAIRWATSMAAWHGISGRCQFVHASTEILLESLLRTQANNNNVSLVLLQFPTPYRLQLKLPPTIHSNDDVNNSTSANGSTMKVQKGGNDKLASSPMSDTFMANPKILQRIADLLHRSTGDDDDDDDNPPPQLLVQSNCEDVALWIHDFYFLATKECRLEAVHSVAPRLKPSAEHDTTRTMEWLLVQQQQQQQQPDQEVRRATGPQWSDEPYLPIFTETEAACEHEGTPIHRCLYRATSTK